MSTKPAISASALVIAMSLASPVTAQLPLTIGGVPVPLDQLLDVQTRCDELLARERSVALAAPHAESPAASASADLATTESTAEELVDPITTGTIESGAADGNMAADTDAAPDAEIDIALVTLELCEAGGFMEPTP
jgi:hypothetical protein